MICDLQDQLAIIWFELLKLCETPDDPRYQQQVAK